VTEPRTLEEFRAFVRTHHPDVGGDPDVFSAGVAAWRAYSTPVPDPSIVFYRKRTLLAQLIVVLRQRLPAPRRPPRTHDRRVR
jgi:hypothetical protein